MSLLHSSYAFSISGFENTEALYVVKNRSSMLINLGKGFNIIELDGMTKLQCTNQFVEIEEGEIKID